MPHLAINNFGGKTWGNVALEEEEKARARETPKTRAARLKKEKNANNSRKAKAKAAANKAMAAAEAEQNRINRLGPNTGNVRRMRSSFKRLYQRNPTSFIKSRRRKLGRPSRTPRSSSPKRVTKKVRAHAAHGHSNAPQGHRNSTNAKPRPGKFMKECKMNDGPGGCARQKCTGDCKFVHRNEPEWKMLRDDQKTKKGGFVVSSPAPLSSVNTYTSWPGGVDPTARLYNQSSMI